MFNSILNGVIKVKVVRIKESESKNAVTNDFKLVQRSLDSVAEIVRRLVSAGNVCCLPTRLPRRASKKESSSSEISTFFGIKILLLSRTVEKVEIFLC